MHGGLRKGAGRKKKPNALRVPLSVYVDSETINLVRALARHLNATHGEVVRRAVARFQRQMLEHYQQNIAKTKMEQALASGIRPDDKPLSNSELDSLAAILETFR